MSVEDDTSTSIADDLDDVERVFDDLEFDSEIGLRMAKDAQRLADGELTEAEFRERYDEVLAALEREDSPTPEPFQELKEDIGTSGIVGKLKGLDGEMERRETMKKMAAGAAALGLGAWATADQRDQRTAPTLDHTEGPEETDTSWGMVIDLDRCDGCLNCVMGCQNENNWGPGENWMYVFSWLDQDIKEQLGDDEEISQEQANFLVRPCQHCNDPPCAYVCPTTARHQREDGLVLTDYDVCIGCRYCQVGCPYGVNYFGWGDPETPEEDLSQVEEYSSSEIRSMDAGQRQEVLQGSGDHIHDARGRRVDSRPPKGVMGKCTMCPSRQDGNMGDDAVGTVACMDWCDSAGMSAIHFGDLNDPDSRPNQYLEFRRELSEGHDPYREAEEGDEEWVDAELIDGSKPPGKHNEYRLLENMGTDPSIVYVGDEPGPHAEQVDPERVEHAATYESIGTVDRRKDYTDQFTDLNNPDGGDD